MNRLTKEQAIAVVGVDAVEAIERVNCEPTNRVGVNGACQGDDSTEWSASIKAKNQDGETVTLIAYYYTTNEQDAAIEQCDGDGSAISWTIDSYSIV